MLNHIKEDGRKYVTLDDGNARRLAMQDPALFFEVYGYPLLIDEFQRAPSILLEMKKIVDEKALGGEDNSGMFWITGSQKFKMMKDVSESLAGRIAIFDMASLSAAEIEERPAQLFKPDVNSLRDRMAHAKRKDIHKIEVSYSEDAISFQEGVSEVVSHFWLGKFFCNSSLKIS